MTCAFIRQDDGRWHCPECGYTTKRAYEQPPASICGNPRPASGKPHVPRILDAHEVAKLFPGEVFPDDDPTLLGNRIAALTTALGIPPCGGCKQRKAWLNKAHKWLRGEA